ncbi:cytochrome b/b6 domain-containing protein [Hymenobacter wooponensis]|uniref:Thiosulfate reductase n=1 Tax=Hymenobacter wooponensis TaxID=1525360 RepID=A0A4Z0MTG0_9BACT|nr:cytochrome b/b6 domain-containing protein [Hymenobacter wooponensis]TGD83102.1 thiosulfate reductase [Hymenobacter wooponensis]
MKQLVEKHPLAIRWFHWVNFPVLALMIWSGIWIYWANDVYRLGWGHTTLLKFFPKSFYQAFHIDHKLAQGMAWHFVLMWVFALNGLLYVAYTLISGEWRALLPSRHSFAEAWQVVRHDLGLRQEPLPARKFNGAQQIAYTAVILMGAGSLLTGLAIYKPTQLAWLTTALGGYEWARAEHFILTIGYVLFFVVHIAQVVRAGWNNFRAMLAGFEVVEVPPPAPLPAAQPASASSITPPLSA